MRSHLLMRSVLDLMYPPLCPLCERLLRGDVRICEACMKTLPRTEQHLLRGNQTEEHLVRNTRVEKAASFLYYLPSLLPAAFGNGHEQDAGRLLRLIKYSNRPELATFLAEAAAREWQGTGFWEDIDLIIPIPLHPRRLRQRGYNQSLFIARGLSNVTGIPVDTTHLLRTHNNRHQARLGEQKRAENVQGIFSLVRPEELKATPFSPPSSLSKTSVVAVSRSLPSPSPDTIVECFEESVIFLAEKLAYVKKKLYLCSRR